MQIAHGVSRGKTAPGNPSPRWGGSARRWRPGPAISFKPDWSVSPKNSGPTFRQRARLHNAAPPRRLRAAPTPQHNTGFGATCPSNTGVSL